MTWLTIAVQVGLWGGAAYVAMQIYADWTAPHDPSVLPSHSNAITRGGDHVERH